MLQTPVPKRRRNISSGRFRFDDRIANEASRPRLEEDTSDGLRPGFLEHKLFAAWPDWGWDIVTDAKQDGGSVIACYFYVLFVDQLNCASICERANH